MARKRRGLSPRHQKILSFIEAYQNDPDIPEEIIPEAVTDLIVEAFAEPEAEPNGESAKETEEDAETDGEDTQAISTDEDPIAQAERTPVRHAETRQRVADDR